MLVPKDAGYPMVIGFGTLFSILSLFGGEYIIIAICLPVMMYAYGAGLEYYEEYSEYFGGEVEFHNKIIRVHMILGGMALFYWFIFDVL